MRHSLLNRALLFLTTFCFLLALTAPITVPVMAKTSGNIQHVYDKAGLLSDSELTSLESMCSEYSQKDDLDIIILTHNDSNAVYAETYIENFYDNNLTSDSVILLIDLYNRDVFIEGYGTAEYSINSNRINSIVEKITPNLTAGNYTAAFEQYIKLSDKYINAVPIYQNVWIHLGLAILIGVIAVIIMAYNSGGRMTVGGATYMDPNNSGLIGRRDDYIRTHITRVRKPQNNGGGGGGGGISAGGHSHSSGGGKF